VDLLTRVLLVWLNLEKIIKKTGFAAQLPEEQIKADAAVLAKSIETRALPSAIYRDPTGLAQKFYEGRMRFGDKFVRVPNFKLQKVVSMLLILLL
jgi:hypothetical protein